MRRAVSEQRPDSPTADLLTHAPRVPRQDVPAVRRARSSFVTVRDAVSSAAPSPDERGSIPAEVSTRPFVPSRPVNEVTVKHAAADERGAAGAARDTAERD